MEIGISEFRRNLFAIIERAEAGEPVIVLHKGRRLRIVPEARTDRLSRLTPLQIVNPSVEPDAEEKMKEDMQREWERDWETL